MFKKFYIYIILLILGSSYSFAQRQDTTEVYNSFRISNDPLRSKWRPILTHKDNLYQLAFYNKKGIIQELINYQDKNLEVRKGMYIKYQEGRKITEGYYDKGHKHGLWLTFSLNGDTIKKEQFYYGKSLKY